MWNIHALRFGLVEAVVHAASCEQSLHDEYNDNKKVLKCASTDFLLKGFLLSFGSFWFDGCRFGRLESLLVLFRFFILLKQSFFYRFRKLFFDWFMMDSFNNCLFYNWMLILLLIKHTIMLNCCWDLFFPMLLHLDTIIIVLRLDFFWRKGRFCRFRLNLDLAVRAVELAVISFGHA